MQAQPKGPLVFSIVTMVLGFGWLLMALEIAPGINWVWTLELATVGILAFVLAGGVDKFSIVVGPFFVVCSVLSLLRQAGSLKEELELPFLVMLIGVLTLVAQSRRIPVPRWFFEPRADHPRHSDKPH